MALEFGSDEYVERFVQLASAWTPRATVTGIVQFRYTNTPVVGDLWTWMQLRNGRVAAAGTGEVPDATLTFVQSYADVKAEFVQRSLGSYTGRDFAVALSSGRLSTIGQSRFLTALTAVGPQFLATVNSIANETTFPY